MSPKEAARDITLRLGLPLIGRGRRWAYPAAAFCGPYLLWHRPTRVRLMRTFAPLCGRDRHRTATAAARSLANAAQYYVDLASVRYRDIAGLERDCLRLSHAERMAILDEPGPRLVIGAHTAGSELALRALLARGHPFTGLVEPVRPPSLSRFLRRWRQEAGGRFYEAGRGGLRACLETLRRGGVVVLMADRDLQGTGVCVEFFGRRARFPRGPWDLAARTGAPVLPILCGRARGDDIHVFIEEPIRVAEGGDRESAIAGAAQCWAGMLERFLDRDPGQWLMLEDFWRIHGCGQG